MTNANQSDPVPGEFTRDEEGRILVSYSALKSFRACAKKYELGHIEHIEPLYRKPGDPRDLGKAVHAAREVLSLNQNADDVIKKHFIEGEQTHLVFEERERARAMLRGYRKMWTRAAQADLECDWTCLETPFRGDITHPQTGEVSDKYAAKGVVDGVMTIVNPLLWGETNIEPGVYLYELKTTSKIDGMYIQKLPLDFQILWYSHYIEDALGVKLKGILYDVIEKTKMEHTEEEPADDFAKRQEVLRAKIASGELRKSEKGGTVKRRKGESDSDFETRCWDGGYKWVANTVKRREREPTEGFQDRLDKTYDNANKFARVVVPITPHIRDDLLLSVWELVQLHDRSRERKVWMKNEDQCFSFFRACDYLPICTSKAPDREIQTNFRLKVRHR